MRPAWVVIVPSFEFGGAEVHAAKIVKLLAARGPIAAAAPEGHVAERLRVEGALVRTVQARGRDVTLLALATAAARTRARSAIVVLPYPDRVSVTLGSILAARRVAVVHCLPETVGLSWPAPAVVPGALGRALERALFQSFDRVVVVHETLVDPLLRRTGIDPARLYVVPNAAADTRCEPRGAPPPMRALVLGRLARDKRVDVAIDALALARSTSTELEIVGDGPLRSDLVARAERCGVLSRVRFRGASIDPSAAIARSHVLLFPSEFEASPVAPLEAMASGLAVVACDTPQIREALPSRGVFYAKPGDAASWADALDAFARDPSTLTALGAEAREAARQERPESAWQTAMRDAIEG